MRLCPLVLVSTLVILACYVHGSPTPVNVEHGDKTEEAVTVTQRTRITRRKRNAVDHVEFPPIMQFRIQFKDRAIDRTLKRNVFMTSEVSMRDANGQIEHDLGRKTGIYQDLDSQSAFVVQCEDFTEHCTLQGSTSIDGRLWDITPTRGIEKLHTAVQTNNDAKLMFVEKAPTIPGDQEFLSRSQYTTRRQKREVPDCFIVECHAIVDETVSEFFLNQTGTDNTTQANELINVYFLALYAQADLHYHFVSFRSPGTCIRLFLKTLDIQTMRNESWSAPNEIDVAGGRIAFVDGEGGLVTCGAQGDVNITGPDTIDLVQCFTRKDIVEDDEGTGQFTSEPRSLAFRETACVLNRTQYASAIFEVYGDKIELLLAHDIALGLGAFEESKTNCSEDDGYIMADDQIINADDLKLRNVWYFSICTLGDITGFLEERPNCLLNNSFGAADFTSFDELPLVGNLLDVTAQCVFTFGNGSEPCDPTGQNRQFLDDMCGRGMFCTEVEFGDGNCTGQTRPFDGTPCGTFGSFCSKSECIIRKGNGENCTCFEDCNAGNSTCSPTTNVCVCAEGFYDNDGATVGGSCVPKVAVNEHCPQADACADPNAMCVGNNCTCNADYYADSGSCFLLKSPGQTCTESKECRGSDVECLGSYPMSCQCPTDRYFDFSSGNCLTKKDLNESCEAGQCADANAICNTVSNMCTCAEGFAEDGGMCVVVCPNGDFRRFEDACYLFGNLELLFSEARTFCDSFDSTFYMSNLVQVDTQGELDFLKEVMSNSTVQPDNGYWSDLFQTGDNGNETYLTSGDLPTVLDWDTTGSNAQPDDRGEIQLCTMFFGQFDYRQADIECLDPNDPARGRDGRKAFPLCKVPLPNTSSYK